MPYSPAKPFYSGSTPWFARETVADLPAPNSGVTAGTRAFVRAPTPSFYTLVPTDLPGNPMVWQPDAAGPALAPEYIRAIVDPFYATAPTPDGPFPSITDAINYLVAGGYGPGPNGPAGIKCMRGSTTEVVSLPDGIFVEGTGAPGFNGRTSFTLNGRFVINRVAPGTGRVCGVSCITVSSAGNAVEISGSGQANVVLDRINTDAAGNGIDLSNTNPSTTLICVNSQVFAQGIGLRADNAYVGLAVMVSGGCGGVSGSVRQGGSTLQLVQQALFQGIAEFNDGISECYQSRFSQGIRVLSGAAHFFKDTSSSGTAPDSPMRVNAGATAIIVGSFSGICDPSNDTIISGGGTVLSSSKMDFAGGRRFSAALIWGEYPNAPSSFDPKCVLVLTAPVGSPYIVPAGVTHLMIAGDMGGNVEFVVQPPSERPNADEVLVTNNDPNQNNQHSINLSSGNLNSGLTPLPLVIPRTRTYTLSGVKNYNTYVKNQDAPNYHLPPPRIQLFPADRRMEGYTRNGDLVYGVGSILFSIEGVPAELLAEPSYRMQIELVRYMPKRSRNSFNPMTSSIRHRRMPQGWFHPVSFVNGSTPPPTAGTRSGSPVIGSYPSGAPIDRPTEWSVTGMSQYERMFLNVAEIFCPFYALEKVFDSFGNASQTLVSRNSGKRRRATGYKGYGFNSSRCVFGFRYAYVDPVSGQFVTGPMSERVFTRPMQWPFVPTGVYPGENQAATPIIDPITGAPQSFILVASIGGEITGRLRG